MGCILLTAADAVWRMSLCLRNAKMIKQKELKLILATYIITIIAILIMHNISILAIFICSLIGNIIGDGIAFFYWFLQKRKG